MQATATDTSGFSETVQASITILPGAAADGSGDSSEPVAHASNETIIVRVQVTGNTSSIVRYDWSFGSGASLGSTSRRPALSCRCRGSQSARRSSRSRPFRPLARAVTASLRSRCVEG